MTRDELNDIYFEWLYQLACDNKHRSRFKYRKLLSHLHSRDFTYLIDMDGNRFEDGINLRYRFGYECDIPDSVVATYLDDRPCSVLEMMMALAIRCEEHIMEDPDIGDRTGQWFWTMVVNLGLDDMTDSIFRKRKTDEIIDIFLNREYKRNGEGGLFVTESAQDMRNIEIWYQMCLYLREAFN